MDTVRDFMPVEATFNLRGRAVRTHPKSVARLAVENVATAVVARKIDLYPPR